MTHTAAQRIRGSRCVACNARATAWLCERCGLASTYVAARAIDQSPFRHRIASAARWRAASDDRETVAGAIGFHRVGGIVESEYKPCTTVSDPRRWCDDCQCYGVHRRGCDLIKMDGIFVGGYESLRPKSSYVPKLPALAAPEPWWSPSLKRQHEKAVRRRWSLFAEQWAKIALHIFTATLETMPLVRARETNMQGDEA